MILPKLLKNYRRLPLGLECPRCRTMLQSFQKHTSGRIALIFCPNATCRYALSLSRIPKPLRMVLAPQIFTRRLGMPRPPERRPRRVGACR